MFNPKTMRYENLTPREMIPLDAVQDYCVMWEEVHRHFDGPLLCSEKCKAEWEKLGKELRGIIEQANP